MNGKDLLESMSYVDEKYIQQAAAPMRRRSHLRWRILAAAACLAVAVLGVRVLLPAQQKNGATMQRSSSAQDTAAARSAAPETAVMEDAVVSAETDSGIAPLSEDPTPALDTASEEAPGTAEMVVRLLRQEADALVCVVTDPGTGSYDLDSEIRIALPDAETASANSTSGALEKAPMSANGASSQAAVFAGAPRDAMTEETSPAAMDEEIIPETGEVSDANQAAYFRVTYLPEEGSLIHPLSMTALDGND